MKRSKFLKEWEHIVGFQLIDIISFKEIEDMPEVADQFYNTLQAVFRMLSKLKHNKFYNQKELQTIFYLVKKLMFGTTDIS